MLGVNADWGVLGSIIDFSSFYAVCVDGAKERLKARVLLILLEFDAP